jgi:hypothetical protein
MPKSNSSQQAEYSHSKINRETILFGNVSSDDPTVSARKALSRAFGEIRAKNTKRSKRIKKLRFLIYELQSIQPAELEHISGAIGQSKNTTKDQLSKLISCELVVKTVFEKHTLYCINGLYNKIISSKLIDGLFDS